MSKKAFTLVELLVVISIIALLLAILMPSLQKARVQSQMIVCSTKVKDQYLAQSVFAESNNGVFFEHHSISPDWVSDDLWKAVDSYVSNPEIFECPLLKRSARGAWEQPYLIDAHDFNGWAYKRENPNSNVINAYNWFANYKYKKPGVPNVIAPDFDFYFAFDGAFESCKEIPWPNKLDECNSRKAFISHRISQNGSAFWDSSHLGIGYVQNGNLMRFRETVKSENSPVGYADGHVSYNKKGQMRPRALINGGAYVY